MATSCLSNSRIMVSSTSSRARPVRGAFQPAVPFNHKLMCTAASGRRSGFGLVGFATQSDISTSTTLENDDPSGIWDQGVWDEACNDIDHQVPAQMARTTPTPGQQRGQPLWNITRPTDNHPSSPSPTIVSTTPVLHGLPPTPRGSASPISHTYLTNHPYDASSDDEESLVVSQYDYSALGGVVGPHSGLEAQDAADYEHRLNAAEARDALMAVKSGQSSDDEDLGSEVDFSPVIARHTEIATEARQRRRAKRLDAARRFGIKDDLESDSNSRSSGSGSGSSSDEGEHDAMALAAKLLAARPVQDEEDGIDMKDMEVPNRFLSVPEPLEPDNIALAASLLQHHQTTASASKGTNSDLDDLIDQVELVRPEFYMDDGLEYPLGLDLQGAHGIWSEAGVDRDGVREGMDTDRDDEGLREALGMKAVGSMDAQGVSSVVAFMRAQQAAPQA